MTTLQTIYHGDEIAIIGMAGRFPGADTLEQFWSNLRDGVESISFFAKDELKVRGIDAALVNHPQYVGAKGVLDNVDRFDASFFGINPREAEVMDPQHRIFLEVAWEALEGAGYAAGQQNLFAGMYVGVGKSEYWLYLYSNPDLFNVTSTIQAQLGNASDYIATRTSYKLGLSGPSLVVQTACSSGLVAVHLACQALLNGECDLALAGAASVGLPQTSGYQYQEGGILSPDGHCRAFDAQAQGTVPGEGVGVVVLKRLADALHDGDQIHAVIKGSALNNDGLSRIGMTAPSVDGQATAIAEAHVLARVEPATISYIEAHGSATPLGDPVEVTALTRAFGAKSQQRQYVAIGSVKTNIGHLDTAAGVAGLIKTVLALKHQQIPPSLHFEHPNPQIDFANTPFYVNTRLTPWPSNTTPRRAGVSSFGIGGTNVHVILEEAPTRISTPSSRGPHLLVLSAQTEHALEAATDQLATYCRSHPGVDLANVAYTLQVGRSVFDYRRTVICQDLEDAAHMLESRDRQRILTTYQTHRHRPVAFLLPGVGDHYVGMAQELYQTEPTFRAALDRCSAIVQSQSGLDLVQVLYAREAADTSTIATAPKLDLRALLGRNGHTMGVSDHLSRTEVAQPALFAVEYALAQLLIAWGLQPRALLGYSLGEYVAACLAGVISLEDALLLVGRRAQMIQAIPSGAMLAVALSEADIQPFLGNGRCLAAISSPMTCVVAGPPDAMSTLEHELAAQQVVSRRVSTTHAFHSTMLEPLVPALTELVRAITLHPPQIPYVSNVTGTWITTEQATDPGYWARHMCQPVRFAAGVHELMQQADLALLEVGPGQALSSFVMQHPLYNANQSTLVCGTLPAAHDAQTVRAALQATLGQLWVSGVSIDWPALWAHEQRLRLDLPTYPFERQRYWIDAPGARASVTQGVPESDKRPSLADWFYLPSWKQTLLPYQSSAQAQPQVWLLLTDAIGLGDHLAEQLVRAGQRIIRVEAGTRWKQHSPTHYTIDPCNLHDYTTLFDHLDMAGLEPTQIVHGWSLMPLTDSDDAQTRFDQAQELGLYSALRLIQTLGQRSTAEHLDLTILTDQAQAIAGAVPSHPEHTPLIAAAMVIAQEYPYIRCRSIDLALPATETLAAPFVAQLSAELLAESDDVVIAYRGTQRLAQTFEPVRIDAVSPNQGLRQGGVYLITGGLGAVGLTLARYLAETVQARLALLGRSGLPMTHTWNDWLANHPETDMTSQRIRQIQAIQSGGSEVLLIEADIGDARQVQAAITQIHEHFGSLHGVIHAAGLTSEDSFGLVAEIDEAFCARHFRPKVQGVYALAKALEGQSLDFCMLFSSIAAVLGGLGLAAYAAANRFLDAFAQQQSSSSTIPWISVNWDGWLFETTKQGSGGLAATLTTLAMSPAEGTEVFCRVIARSGTPQIVISTSELATRVAQWVKLESLHNGADALPTRITAQHPRPMLAKAYVAPQTALEQVLSGIWQEVLGITQVGLDDSFFELGGNSLIGLQVVSRVRNLFQIELPLRDLFETPTIAKLAAKMQQDPGEATRLVRTAEVLLRIAQMSEEEATALVDGDHSTGQETRVG